MRDIDPVEVKEFSLSDLISNPRNARTHTPAQIRQISESIRNFGFVNPVLIDAANNIIAGHGRLEAAKLLGLEHVPGIQLSHLTQTQKRALALADNKLAENAGWDVDLLAEELQFLSEIDIDFNVSVTGFVPAEVDLLIESLKPEEDPEASALPDLPEAEDCAVRPGDLWVLDRHRLLCGDATEPATLRLLMADDEARLVFTDPPYNVPIDGHVSGLGRVKHSEFAMASGEMSAEAFTAFLECTLGNLARHSMEGAIHFVCMDWRHLGELLAAGRSVYGSLLNVCVWVKTNGGMGSLYRSQHELVLVFKKGKDAHINNVELGKHGRYRTNVWNYAGANAFGAGRDAALAMHPTVKPVAMVADAILDGSRRGEIVLDGFAGSGTLLIAAERTGRIARALELDPRYVETAIQRWQDYTGGTAIHEETGASFDALREQRLTQAKKTQETTNGG
ncbi:ParB N-terminal domain-containing protein [Rhodospirillaceae bacterium AH-315-P19]|nr:ParB N-terminal domain-containing protein [Rhodospirillaceae bacterium AH-315-P19]